MTRERWLDLLIGTPLLIGAALTFLPLIAMTWGL